MYKVFSGQKCVVISAKEIQPSNKYSKEVVFVNAESLHKEYMLFSKSNKLDTLIIIGEEEKVWKVFCSFFSYIEAAGGLVFNPKGELLMIYRNKYWDLPKGKMEVGESPDQTAVREVEEECGVKNLKIVRQLASTYHIYFQDKKDCIKQTYWFEMSSNDTTKPSPQQEEGIEEAKWMGKEEVKKIRRKVYLSLQEILRTTFSS
jgi:8-oxo-dGTP pyrophosphatase MutT (NUDIX family)